MPKTNRSRPKGRRAMKAKARLHGPKNKASRPKRKIAKNTKHLLSKSKNKISKSKDKVAKNAKAQLHKSKGSAPNAAQGKMSNEERLLKDMEQEFAPLGDVLSKGALKLKKELDKKKL